MKNYFFSSLERSNNNQRMHPTIKLIMWMSVFLLIFTVENVYSQADTLRCELADSCSPEFQTQTPISRNLGSGITAIIWYKRRSCNGVYQIMVDSIKALDNGNYLDIVNRYHYKYKVINELVDIYLLQELFANVWTPSDSSTPIKVAQVYKQVCGVWLHCGYNINPNSINCEQGFDPLPSTSDTLRVFRWQPCGFVCCKKTYEIYRKTQTPQYDPQVQVVQIKLLSTGRSTYHPTCTEQPKYDEPCQDGC